MNQKKKKKKKKNKKIKAFRHRVEYLFMLGIMKLAQSVSLKTTHRIANGMGWFTFNILRVRRDVVRENLAHAFPDKSESERVDIALRTYKNFSKMVLEYIRFPVLDKETILSLVEVDGIDAFDWIKENGKGGVLVAGHFGNWELMGAAIAQMGYEIAFLVGEQHNKAVDAKMNEYRELMGIRIIHMGVAVRGVIKTLRRGGMVALLSDQDARREGIFVDFFGRPASTPQGPAVFALKTKAPILFGSAIRLPNGRHRVEAKILKFDHLDGVTPENIREVTQAYTSCLEDAVRRYPDHWFWMHKRWKTKPKKENPIKEL